MRRALALLGVTAVLLSGCEAAPVYGPSPTPSTPPIFATEEDAVEAAKDAFDAYMDAANRMAQSGGTDMSGYEGVVSDSLLAEEEIDAADFRANGTRLVGDLTTFGFQLQQLHQDDKGAQLQAYVCVDLTGTSVVNTDGDDLSARNHRHATPYEALFEASGPEPRFSVEEVRRWSGRDFCSSD